MKKKFKLNEREQEQIDLLKKYYEIDDEKRIIKVVLHYESVDEILLCDIESINHPQFDESLLRKISDLFASFPLEYKVDICLKIDDYKGFDPKDIESILIPMREIFSKVLILPTFKIEDDAHWINDLGGDSMSYVELIRDVQEKFGIEFPEELLGQMATINDFVYEVAKLQKGPSQGKGKNKSK